MKATIFAAIAAWCFVIFCLLFLTFFCLIFLFFWFQAPPPGKLSDDIDGSSDLDADKKGLDSEMDMVRTSVAPILLIGIISWSIGYWILIDLFLLFFGFHFSWGEEIRKRRMVKGLGEGWILIWRTRRSKEFQPMSSCPRSSHCSWIWRSPVLVMKNHHQSDGSSSRSHNNCSSRSPQRLR